MKPFYFGSKKSKVLFTIFAACLLAAAAAWATAGSESAVRQPPNPQDKGAAVAQMEQTATLSKAVFDVGNMSCGGCVDTIQRSVAGLPGTDKVNVDLTSATATVLYDGNVLADPQVIAQAITDSGYPATVQRTTTPRQLQKEMAQAAELAKTSIASAGRRTILREAYDIELNHARTRYEQVYGAETFASSQGKQLLQRIQLQIAQRLIDDAIKHQEVDRAGAAVESADVDKVLLAQAQSKSMTLEQFQHHLEANGYPFDYFRRKTAQRVALQRYLEDNVYADSTDPDDRRQRYAHWLANARTLATVVYYDETLAALAASGSGGSCGGSGSCKNGGCSVSR
jgi:copper chaperone CopZ